MKGFSLSELPQVNTSGATDGGKPFSTSCEHKSQQSLDLCYFAISKVEQMQA